MDDAFQTVGAELGEGGVTAGRGAGQMRGQRGRAARRSGQPQRPAFQMVSLGEEGRELAQAGMQHEAGITGGNVPHDGGILLLVADQVAHRGQAARDGMRPVGNAVPERQVVKNGHGIEPDGHGFGDLGVVTQCKVPGRWVHAIPA